MNDENPAGLLREFERRGNLGDGVSAATWRQAASLLRATLDAAEPGLDEAWRAAQQAAPAGWWIGVERDHHGMYRGTAWEMGSRVGTIVGTIGSFGTEAGAIRALAARLAKESGR